MYVIIDTRKQTPARLGVVVATRYALFEAVQAVQLLKAEQNDDHTSPRRPTIWKTGPGRDTPRIGDHVGYFDERMDILAVGELAAWREYSL